MNDPGQRNAQLPHILYADSDTELQKKFLNYCTDHSPASVIPAASANEVLEIITSKPVDALVLADNLSDMTVANLLINIREQKKAFPIILFTESCDPVDVPEADLVELCLKRGKQPSRKFRELTTLTLEAAERQQVLRELSENERRLTDIINFLPDATLAINREGVVIIWNKAIETMTGIPAEKILGKSNYDYSIPFYGERRPILVDIILSGSEVNEENYQVIERQENRIVVEAFARALNRGKGAYLWGIVSPLYDGQGKIIGAIESIRDITERRKTENALKERENQYRSLVEASPDLIWEVTKTGIFKYISPNCADILGYTAEELIGTSIHQFAPRKSLSK